jgi:SAM-dependent methyltransferase
MRPTTELRALGEQAMREGRNVTHALREHLGTDRNTPEAIEVAYDLQAGSYVDFAEKQPDFLNAYAEQLAGLLDPHLQDGDVLLDAGTGEMTTLAHILKALRTPLARVYASDISSKRLAIGQDYAAKHGVSVEPLHAELASIPLPNESVSVVTTNHALEPNGGREREILSELLRVTKRKLVLFEPCFELASDEGKARMRQHGYIQDLAHHATHLGAIIESVTPLEMVHNPLNPTTCFVISKNRSA